MNVYLAPDGLWHIRVDSHELRQHYFTRESAVAASLAYAPRSVIGSTDAGQ